MKTIYFINFIDRERRSVTQVIKEIFVQCNKTKFITKIYIFIIFILFFIESKFELKKY